MHVVASLKDQPWQLSAEELAKVAEGADGSNDGVKNEDSEKKPKEEDVKNEDVKKETSAERIPRVEVRLSGELLPDSRYATPTAAPAPFTAYLHRLVLETPSRDPAVTPVSAQPLSWTRPVAPASASSLPPALSASYPTSPSPLALRLALYPAHPAGDRFALHPELARVLDLAESDRVGVLEAMWAYAKARGLVVEQQEGANPAPGGTTAQGAGAIKSGIKTDERIAKVGRGSFVVRLPLDLSGGELIKASLDPPTVLWQPADGRLPPHPRVPQPLVHAGRAPGRQL